MGIFDRMSRVISSNFNALLDTAEDPRKSIEQTLREMANEVKAARQEVVRAVAAEKQLRQKVEDLTEEVEKWARRAELAVKHDDDNLARDALLQKQRVTQERDRATQLRAEARGQALQMKQELERMEAKVEELKVRKGALVARAQQAKSGTAEPEGLGAPVGGRAFEEFRRMEDQIEGVEATFAAQREVEEALGGRRGPGGLTRDEVEARFRALEAGVSPDEGPGRGAVDDELAALKKRIRIGS